ncbi:MAG: hypothetical protein H9W81_03355 [Enterococcus sp.]|nr:hypothetical protein [Enterococcus sp.]
MDLTAEDVELAKTKAITTQSIESHAATVVKTCDIPALAGFKTDYAVIRSYPQGAGIAYTAKTESEALDTFGEMLYHINELLYC